MSNLTPFWRLLEIRPSRAAVMAEWRTVAGDSLPAICPLLRPINRPATAYPNPRPGGRPMKVVRHADSSIVAIDERDCRHRLNLKPKDVVLHQLDLRKLRTALCESLSCVNIAKTPVDQATQCLQIGNWEPKKAASFPVYLLLCRHRRLLRQEVLDLTVRCKRPGAILLTPTRMNWNSDLDGLTRNRKILLVAISEVVEPTDGGFQESPAWEEYLQAFCQMVKLTLPGNYRNKKPVPMRGMRAANIEKLEKELERHIIAARDHAHSLHDRGLVPVLLPKPEQKDLARHVGINESSVSRCLNDERAKVLKILWDTADSLDGVMRFKRRR